MLSVQMALEQLFVLLTNLMGKNICKTPDMFRGQMDPEQLGDPTPQTYILSVPNTHLVLAKILEPSLDDTRLLFKLMNFFVSFVHVCLITVLHSYQHYTKELN